MKKSNPLVTICCITYNHEPYIRKCIEGFLMQKTNFPYEIIIHDDASTDNTIKIIHEYQTKYSKLIKPIYQTENQYSKGVKRILATFVFPHTQGKYIALCEGDDYWTDPMKLQRQVDFLEKNEEYGLVHTNYIVVDECNRPTNKFNRTYSSGDVFDLILKNSYNIVTATVLFRSSLCKKEKLDFNSQSFVMGDLPMWLEFSFYSKVKYLNNITTCYRVLKESASHLNNIDKYYQFQENSLFIREFFALKYGQSFNKKKAYSKLYESMIKECFLKGKDISTSRDFYFKMIRANWQSILFPLPFLFFWATKSIFIKKFVNFLYKIS